MSTRGVGSCRSTDDPCTGATRTRDYRRGGVSNGTVLSQGSGGWKSKSEVSVGLLPSGGREGKSVVRSPLVLVLAVWHFFGF